MLFMVPPSMVRFPKRIRPLATSLAELDPPAALTPAVRSNPLTHTID